MAAAARLAASLGVDVGLCASRTALATSAVQWLSSAGAVGMWCGLVWVAGPAVCIGGVGAAWGCVLLMQWIVPCVPCS
eukprot:2175412-Prorocentrum_lima.AAC.1